MEFSQIMQLVGSVIALIVVIAVFVIILIRYIKQYKNATTESEKQAALNEMFTVAIDYITNAESTYDALVSSISGSSDTETKTGGLKKDSVMSKLLTYALNKGYEYDETYWSNAVDTLVELTKKVNAESEEATTSTATTAATTAASTTATATR